MMKEKQAKEKSSKKKWLLLFTVLLGLAVLPRILIKSDNEVSRNVSSTKTPSKSFVDIVKDWMRKEKNEYAKIAPLLQSEQNIEKLEKLKKEMINRHYAVPYQKEEGIKKDIWKLISEYSYFQMETMNNIKKYWQTKDEAKLKLALEQGQKAKKIFEEELPKKIQKLESQK